MRSILKAKYNGITNAALVLNLNKSALYTTLNGNQFNMLVHRTICDSLGMNWTEYLEEYIQPIYRKEILNKSTYTKKLLNLK